MPPSRVERPARKTTQTLAKGGATRSVFAVERAADVLAAICADLDHPHGVKDLSEMLGMSVSTVHRMLAALVRKQFVRQDPLTSKYSAGPWLLEVALTYLRQLNLPQAALPHMNSLRDQTSETVTLSLRDGRTRIYLAQVESPQEIRQTVETGRRLPLHLGGSGKAILAFLPDDEIEAYLRHDTLTTPSGDAIDVTALRRDLSTVRRLGFASSRSERLPGAASVAAPLRNYQNVVVGCLSVSGPVGRFGAEAIARYGPLVRQAADEVSRSLGAAGRTPTPETRQTS
jgi:IclR family transcriptional regulator, acetate operon repressor